MRKSKPVSVTLGDPQERVEARVRTGNYTSASEVMCAAIRALDREDEALDELLRRKVKAALDDPRPSIPAEEVFRDMRSLHAQRLKAAKRGS
jgi:antitoxin ParD1/3/4